MMALTAGVSYLVLDLFAPDVGTGFKLGHGFSLGGSVEGFCPDMHGEIYNGVADSAYDGEYDWGPVDIDTKGPDDEGTMTEEYRPCALN